MKKQIKVRLNSPKMGGKIRCKDMKSFGNRNKKSTASILKSNQQIEY